MAKTTSRRNFQKPAKQIRRKQYRPPDAGALLITRQQVARLLSCSTATVIRLEIAGRLDPIKLADSEHGTTFYRADEVRALARLGRPNNDQT